MFKRLTNHSTQEVLGQYPTPAWLAEAIYERHFLNLTRNDVVCEPSCGPGAFLAAVPDEIPAFGVDIDPSMVARARAITRREVILGDFCTVDLPATPTVLLGNPPFKLALIDAFLARAHDLLPEGGRIGFVLPSYAFQTARRVVAYNDDWSIYQEAIPRSVYSGLKLPLCFAIFTKDRLRNLVGLAFYHEANDIQSFPNEARLTLTEPSKSIWKDTIHAIITRLGGEASLAQIYSVLEQSRPTENRWWKEKVRQTLRRYKRIFYSRGDGRYAIAVV